jgi:hypothetical protein
MKTRKIQKGTRTGKDVEGRERVFHTLEDFEQVFFPAPDESHLADKRREGTGFATDFLDRLRKGLRA